MDRVKMTERLPADVRTPERHLFTLRVAPYRKGMGPTFEVRAYDSHHQSAPYGHSHISLELFVREDGKARVFSFDKWIGLPRGEMIDGTYAKREALEAVAMKPGDTDDDEFFACYPPELLDIVSAHGDAIGMVALGRYGED